MRWIKWALPAGVVLILSCEVPTGEFENPLDIEAAEEEGILPPALVFFPDSISVNTGNSVSIRVFAMEVDSMTGAHIQLTYDNANLSLTSVKPGDFLEGSGPPLFFYEDDPASGILDIHTIYLGTDSASVSGTGSLANLVFGTTAQGESTLQYTQVCELVDQDGDVIEILGFGKGVIVAR
ncbi:MAG: cohesin domain-containing protein [Candidatus Neomarinimicrobiota bacterium]